MPPLAPNLSQSATLRTISGWNNSSMSRRSNTMRGLLSTRTPQSSDTTSGAMLNPPLPPSIISEAMPRGAAGSFTPRVVLSRSAGALPLSTWAGATWTGGGPLTGLTYTSGNVVSDTVLFTRTGGGGPNFSIRYDNGVLEGFQLATDPGGPILNPTANVLTLTDFTATTTAIIGTMTRQ